MIQNLLLARQAQNARDDEEEDTKRLTKSQLYAMISDRWLVPPQDSKGVNRRWLLAVHRGQAFRVEVATIMRFEVEVPRRLQKKTCFTNLADLVLKLNLLLVERGLLELQFSEHVVPDEGWLLRICRYLDQTNILGVFSDAIPDSLAPPSLSQRFLLAQQAAQRYLFGGHLLDSQDVFNSVRSVAEAYKRLLNLHRDVEEATYVLQSLRDKFQTTEAQLATLLFTASTTIMTHGHNMRDPDRIYVEDQENQAFRLQLNEVSTL